MAVFARQSTLADDKQAVAHTQQFAEIRGYQDDAGALAKQFIDNIVNFYFPGGVHALGGFVKQVNIAPRGQVARNQRFLLVAVAQV